MREAQQRVQTEIMYESIGKTPDGNSFMSVKKARGYYEYAERGGVDSIAFILFDSTSNKLCLINEYKPPLDDRYNSRIMLTTAFGGSIDMNKSKKEICQIEILEEAGYDVPKDKIHYVGKTMVSSQMSQICHLFLVDVSNIKKTHLTEFESEISEEQKDKDATEFSNNSLIWMSPEELIENNDWKSIFILSKSLYLDIV